MFKVRALPPLRRLSFDPIRQARGVCRRATESLAVVFALVASSTATAWSSPSTASDAAVPAVQQLAMLNHTIDAYGAPRHGARVVESVSRERPITGERTVLPVVARTTDSSGGVWLKVLLPGRPNGHSGWVSARTITQATTRWRIAIRTSTRQVSVFSNGRLVRTFLAVVGAPSTPTPVGHFFVEETIRLDPSAVGAPYALALSARSIVLQEFDGGPGQIALHGLDNVGGTPGTAASHGCIRLTTGAISWLAGRIEPGAPVTITR